MDESENLRAHRFLRVAVVALGLLAYWRLVFWDALSDLKPIDAWLFLPTDPFPQAIFLASAALVYRRRESLRRAMRSRGSPVLAVLPLLVGSALFVWSHYVDAMDLALVSFLLVSIGAGLLWYGVDFARALTIPWIVLAFAIRIPAVATNQAFYALRLWTAAHATALLRFFGIPVLRDGNVIFGPGVTASVIDTCSGLRTIEILTLVAIFYVGWFPARRSRQLLLVAMAPVVAYVFNLVRICVIAMAPTSEFSTAHTAQGLTVYAAAIVCLILLDRILGRVLPSGTQSNRAALRPPSGRDSQSATESESQPICEPESQPANEPGFRPVNEPGFRPVNEPGFQLEASAQTEKDPASASRSNGRIRDVALAVLAVAMLGVSIWMPRWSAYPELPEAPINLPAKLDGWTKRKKIPLDNEFLWTVRYARSEYRIYERDGDEISVFVGEDDHRLRRRSIISRKNAVPRRGFQVLDRDSVELKGIQEPVERIVARSRLAYVLSYYWYENTDSLLVELFRAEFATDQSPLRRSQPARVIRVTTAVDSTPTGQGRAERDAKLRAFASALAAALRG